MLEGRAILPGTGHEAGRQLLGEMYRKLTGKALPPIVTESGGKPYFQDSPLHFSITHTKAHVFCALCDHPVGLDAEELTRTVKPGLAEKILSPGEYAQYCEAEDKNLALLKFWVLKEARAKLTGRGILGYPNHTDFSLADPRIFYRGNCVLALMEDNDAF